MRLPRPIWTRFLSTPTVMTLATLGPVGTRFSAPGTWGSVAGLLYFIVIFYPQGDLWNILFSALGAYAAAALCGEAEFRLGRRDPGEVVLDEFVAMPLCFLGWRSLAPALPHWAIFLIGLALFRLFDISKPFGIRRIEKLPGGWGVALDDTAAALAACACLHAGARVWIALRG